MEKSSGDVSSSPTESTLSERSAAGVVARTDHDVEKNPHTNELESDSQPEADPNAVDWDGPDDPALPLNWPARRKWKNLILVSILTLLT